MSQTNWEADKMLDVYIYDYLVKRNLQASAQAFQAEGKVSSDPVAIDAPGGFLFEWWSVFWDIFIARTNDKHSEVAASYIETQQLKTREQQQLQLQLLRHQQQQQQPRRDVNHPTINSGVNNMGSDATVRQSTANAMATKIYEECLKHPQKREAIEEASLKRYAENPNQLLDANQVSLLKASATPGQSAGQMLQSGSSNMNPTIQQAQIRNQSISAVNQDVKTDVTGILNQRSSAPDSAIFGVPNVVKPSLLSPGINQVANTLPLKGWPLTGLDQLRPNMIPAKSFVQSPQQYHQIQALNPQQQQQLLLQAQVQGNLGSPNLAAELDSRRIKMILNRSTMLNKEGQPSGISDMMQGLGSPMQMTQNNPELIMKIPQQQAPSHQQQIQQLSAQQAQASQQQIPALSLQQQERILAGVVDGNLSNNYRHNELTVSKGPSGRKRKQPPSSSGPTNSTGTGNTVGPNSAPSTPSIHTPGDVISMASALQHSGSTSKSSLNIYGSDGTGPLPTSSNQLAEIDRFPEDASLDDHVESFLSYDEADQRENHFSSGKRSPSGHNMDVSKGLLLTEIRCIKASNSKVVACHFSPDGKLLASAGHDKKAVLWSMENFKPKGTLEEHNFCITDVRFSGIATRLATSSYDRTVKVWDVNSPSYSLRSFTGHRGPVMSLDFSPVNEDILCSCDGDNEIRYWSVNQGACTKTFPGGTYRVRFQPRVGRFLAAAAESTVSIFDVETTTSMHCLQGHTKTVHAISWEATGDYVASVSEDSVRVWSLRSGSEGQCVYELSCNGNKFHSCVFHPANSRVLVIGCYQSIELWQIQEKKSVTIPAHEGLIESLAQSSVTGTIASASQDKCVKLWR